MYRGAGGKKKRSCQFSVQLNNCNIKDLSCERKTHPGDFSSRFCWMWLLMFTIFSSIVGLSAYSKDANTCGPNRNMSGHTDQHKQERMALPTATLILTRVSLSDPRPDLKRSSTIHVQTLSLFYPLSSSDLELFQVLVSCFSNSPASPAWCALQKYKHIDTERHIGNTVRV